jgi:hypothetical protein
MLYEGVGNPLVVRNAEADGVVGLPILQAESAEELANLVFKEMEKR